jgi:preprotein translocase subunit SecA
MLAGIMNFFHVGEDVPIKSKTLTRQIEGAQKRIEGRNFGIRRRVLQYDDVMNSQRSEVYADRQKVLHGEDIHQKILNMIPEIADSILSNSIDINLPYTQWDIVDINKKLEEKLLPSGTNFLSYQMAENLSLDEILSQLVDRIIEEYEKKIAEYKEQGFDYGEVERFILLKVVDDKWTEHIDAMDQFRKSVGLKGYAQQDPIMYYKKEGYDMYYEMVFSIANDTVALLLKLKVERTEPMKRTAPTVTREGRGSLTEGKSEERKKQKNSTPAISRNANCPCGSRKKYKHCCGK